MDCYGWLIAPFQLLSCSQKQQAEAKIMDLFSTHPLRSVSHFMCSQMHVGRWRGVRVCVCVYLWEHMPMYLAAEVCVSEYLLNGFRNITFSLMKVFMGIVLPHKHEKRSTAYWMRCHTALLAYVKLWCWIWSAVGEDDETDSSVMAELAAKRFYYH